MSSRSSFGLLSTGFLVLFVFLCNVGGAHAFGAGNIPSYAYLEGKAFRHGDLEDTLEALSKGAGGAAGLLGSLTGGLLVKKFGGLDIKRIYFGNWLRDYSQAMDVAGLSKLSRQAIINLVMVLGFLAHGYATEEFEVTEERLGVYLPTEHIDNPKDYNENKDARTVHPKLRGPVNPQELEIDHQTGMLNYIGNEHGGWSTSKAVVRDTLLHCIELGRQARGGGGNGALYEAYRLLGQALHTLEDFPAHSNYCELVLLKMGHNQVFCHVGSNVHVRAPNGHGVPPLVTGTFGGSDFIHSLLGEAGDHISSASVSDLNAKVQQAKSQPTDRGIDSVRDMLFQLPSGEGQSLSRDMNDLDNLRAAPGKNPMDMSPQELHAVLWKILSFRDRVSKAIEVGIEKIPGLSSLLDKLGDSIASFVFVTLEPYLKPVMQQATAVLSQGSAQVVNSQDQFRVFNDPNFHHPTHSLLAKDHFHGILNEPAGKVACIIVKHVVEDVVHAWTDNGINPRQLVENLLNALYHPHFGGQHPIQREMEDAVKRWFDSEDKNYTLNALTKDAVKNHKNHRKGHAMDEHGTGPGGYQSFLPTPQHLQHQASGFVQQQLHGIPGYNQVQQGLNQFHQTFPGREMGPGDSYNQQPAVSSYNDGGYGGNSNYDQHSNNYQAPPQPHYQGDNYGGYDQNQNNFQGPPHHGGYGGPPPPAHDPYNRGPPHDAYGQAPPPPHFGGGPPFDQGGYNQQQNYQNPNAYPGQGYQQQNQGGYPGQGWNQGPPPSGRWG